LLIKNAKQSRRSKKILSLNLIDTKGVYKKRTVKTDLFSAMLFAFQFRPRLFLLVKNNYRGQEEKSKNHNIAGKIRALGKYLATMILRK